MKNFGKNTIIIFINFLVFLILFFVFDFFVYFSVLKTYPKDFKPKYSYIVYNPTIKFDSFKNFFENKEDWKGRLPDGLEYKNNKKPIVIFGCSYAYGFKLSEKQTVSYKLAHLLKKTVYNRAVTACSFQHMLLQLSSDDFYNEVPKPDKIVYILMEDHYRRMLIDGRFGVPEKNFYLHYSLKNGVLTKDSYNSPKKNFIKSLYIVNWAKEKHLKNYILKANHVDEVTDLALKYFIQSRGELVKRYKSSPEIIVFFWTHNNNMKTYKESLKHKLEANGFKTLDAEKLTNENLLDKKYCLSATDTHPNEAAWDLLVPLIAKNL